MIDVVNRGPRAEEHIRVSHKLIKFSIIEYRGSEDNVADRSDPANVAPQGAISRRNRAELWV